MISEWLSGRLVAVTHKHAGELAALSVLSQTHRQERLLQECSEGSGSIHIGHPMATPIIEACVMDNGATRGLTESTMVAFRTRLRCWQ